MAKRIIEKWYYSNLNSAKEKRYQQQIVAAIFGFPSEVFDRYQAVIENENMPETKEEVCEAIQADGFPEWRIEKFDGYPWSKVWLASNWTKLQMLRTIAENTWWNGAVMSTDRGFPVVPFAQIEKKVEAALNFDDLRALSLHWIVEPWENHFNHANYETLAMLEPSGVDGILKNFYGTSSIFYFTPKGAAHFLDVWKRIPHEDFQGVLMHERFERLSGYYACNPHLALTLPAIAEINDNKDIFLSEIRTFETELNPLWNKDKFWTTEE